MNLTAAPNYLPPFATAFALLLALAVLVFLAARKP